MQQRIRHHFQQHLRPQLRPSKFLTQQYLPYMYYQVLSIMHWGILLVGSDLHTKMSVVLPRLHSLEEQRSLYVHRQQSHSGFLHSLQWPVQMHTVLQQLQTIQTRQQRADLCEQCASGGRLDCHLHRWVWVYTGSLSRQVLSRSKCGRFVCLLSIRVWTQPVQLRLYEYWVRLLGLAQFSARFFGRKRDAKFTH